MEQNRSRGMGMQYRPPVVSGSEDWRQRTGVALRSVQPSMRQSTVQKKTQQNRQMARAEQKPEWSEDCTGVLPCSAPLANPYVPFQRENPARYSKERALARGTLYPGLDLPLCGMVNGDKPNTPLNELSALQFAVTELGLYLDTHPEDAEALALFREYAERTMEARAAYEERFGPLLMQNAGEKGCWDWICDPWPWEFCQEG